MPSVVLAESISGRQRSDANVNRFLKMCDLVEELPERTARRAGSLRAAARQGSAVDAIVVAAATDEVPAPLVEQLKPGGRMIIPLHKGFAYEQLVLVEKHADQSITTREILPVRFVPLTGDHD